MKNCVVQVVWVVVVAVGLLVATGNARAESVTEFDEGAGDPESLFASGESGDGLGHLGSFSHGEFVPPDSGLLGDMNHDGVVDTGDVSLFVLALTNPGQYESLFGIGPELVGDINQDGSFDTGDVSAFVALLTGAVDGGTWSSGGSEPGDGTPTVAPLPAAAWAGLGLLGVLGLVHAVRRRSATAAA